MVDLISRSAEYFGDRIVILDLPPLLVVDDCLVVARQTDSILLVTEEGVTRKGDIRRALDLLQGNHLIGAVLNKSKGGAFSRDYYVY